MPDPRKPQRPQQRQPAPQPHRGYPPERPIPYDPAHDKMPGVHLGDPTAAARRGAARPVRTLDPSQQPPPIEFERKIRKGETYWIMGHEEVPVPRKGKIIRLSNEIGKGVGVEFVEPIGGVDGDGQPWGVNHTCDGRGRLGHCLYVRPDQVLDEKAMQAHKARQAEMVEASTFEEYDEMTVGPQHSMPLSPAITPPEHVVIGAEDVGTMKAEDFVKTEEPDKDEDEDE